MDTICDCCGQRRDILPFHHDAHDDSGDSWDYCQQCYDAGCDLRSCSLPLGVITSNGTAMTIEEYAEKAQAAAPAADIPQAAPVPSLAQKQAAQQEAIAKVQAVQQQAKAQMAPTATAFQPHPPHQPPMPSAAQLQAAGVALPTSNPPTADDLMKALSGDADPNPVDEKAKEDKPKKEKPPVVPSFLVDSTGEEAVIADVSTFDDPAPRLEVHKLSPLVQDGRRRILDGSSTQGLSITQCGINQESRSHGWFIVNSESQHARINQGEIPVCEKCYPPYENEEL